MEQMYFMISDAAKKVEVETHVLRYWEEELGLTIKRNELGHRYYTKEDVERFIHVKKLKEQGFQLKAIRLILVNGNLKRIGQDGKLISHNFVETYEKEEKKEEGQKAGQKAEYGTEKTLVAYHSDTMITEKEEGKKEKALRLQFLLKQMISEAVRENNQELSDDIKSSVLKELDYQFRAQEEREEEREKERREREEEHYRKLDETMRTRMAGKNRKKRNSLLHS